MEKRYYSMAPPLSGLTLRIVWRERDQISIALIKKFKLYNKIKLGCSRLTEEIQDLELKQYELSENVGETLEQY